MRWWNSGNRVNHATHLVLLQHHKVKMLDALLRILSHPLDKRRIRNDIADIFIYERVPAQTRPPASAQLPAQQHTKHAPWHILCRTEPIPLFLRLDDIDFRIFLALEPVSYEPSGFPQATKAKQDVPLIHAEHTAFTVAW
jgi:hypothetical protein